MTIQDMPTEPTVIAETTIKDGDQETAFRLVYSPAEYTNGAGEPIASFVVERKVTNAMGEAAFLFQPFNSLTSLMFKNALGALIGALYRRNLERAALAQADVREAMAKEVSRLAMIYRRALAEIVDNADGCGREHPEYKHQHTSEYGHGFGHGHRCAAEIALAALEAEA